MKTTCCGGELCAAAGLFLGQALESCHHHEVAMQPVDTPGPNMSNEMKHLIDLKMLKLTTVYYRFMTQMLSNFMYHNLSMDL